MVEQIRLVLDGDSVQTLLALLIDERARCEQEGEEARAQETETIYNTIRAEVATQT